MDIKIDEKTVIVFDLDDTLYNELDYLKSAYIEIAKNLDFQNWRLLYSTMLALYRSNKNVFDFLVSSYDVGKNKLMAQYRGHFPEIKLFDGVLDLVKQVKMNRGKIGIITDGRAKAQRNKIEALGIMNYIDEIIISEELGSEKPQLENFQAIETAFPLKNYCYIADNLSKDFVTPNKMGWLTIGLIDNGKNIHFNSHKYFKKTPFLPDHFIFSYTELLKT